MAPATRTSATPLETPPPKVHPLESSALTAAPPPETPAGMPARSEATVRREPSASARDVRRKRWPALSFLLRVDTARRAVRVLTLLALDFAGLAAAIFTALVLKAAVLSEVSAHGAYEETRSILAFAYLLTALLFARSGLYAVRAQRPGMARIVGCLFQVTFVALLFALVSGEHFSSYYIFWGSLAFALLYIPLLRLLYERSTGAILRAAGYERRAVLVGTGEHIREVAHALRDAPHSRIEVVGFVSPNALPANGLRSLGALRDLEQILSPAHPE